MIVTLILLLTIYSPRLEFSKLPRLILQSSSSINELDESIPIVDALGSVCSICLQGDELDEDPPDTVGPCDDPLHKFHQECLSKWLQKQKWCPMCKKGKDIFDRTPMQFVQIDDSPDFRSAVLETLFSDTISERHHHGGPVNDWWDQDTELTFDSHTLESTLADPEDTETTLTVSI